MISNNVHLIESGTQFKIKKDITNVLDKIKKNSEIIEACLFGEWDYVRQGYVISVFGSNLPEQLVHNGSPFLELLIPSIRGQILDSLMRDSKTRLMASIDKQNLVYCFERGELRQESDITVDSTIELAGVRNMLNISTRILKSTSVSSYASFIVAILGGEVNPEQLDEYNAIIQNCETIVHDPNLNQLFQRADQLKFIELSYSKDEIMQSLWQAGNELEQLRNALHQLDNEMNQLIYDRHLLFGAITAASVLAGIRHRLVGYSDFLKKSLFEIKKEMLEGEVGSFLSRSVEIGLPDNVASKVELIKEDIETAAYLSELLQDQVAAVTKISSDIGFIDSEELELDDLQAIIESTIRALGLKIHSRSILPKWIEDSLIKKMPLTTEVKWSNDFPEKICFPKGIFQIIVFILVQNAKDAIGHPTVSTKQIVIDLEKGENNSIVISVEDSGVGMTSQQLEKLRKFKPFYSTKELGTGLGLFMVKQILDHLDGELEIWSKPNKGSRFKLVLPYHLPDSNE